MPVNVVPRPFGIERADAIPFDQLELSVDRVPDQRLSRVGKQFAVELLRYNREKILRLKL